MHNSIQTETRNYTRFNNRDDLFHLSFTLKNCKDCKPLKNLCAKHFTYTKLFCVHKIVNLTKIYFLKRQKKHVNQTTAIYIVIGIFNLYMFSRTLDIKYHFACSRFFLYRIIRMICFYCVFYFFILIQFVLLYFKKNKGTKERSIVYRSK